MALIEFDGVSPQVHPEAWVAPDASLIGRVALAQEASVFYGSVLRGDMEDISLGRRSNIQDRCVVHTTPGLPVTVGDDVSVGHAAVLHGCTVEDDCLISMGAIVLDGARVGRGSVVAAGAVVPEGMEIAPGSLVAGVPATKRRDVSAERIDELRANAATYVDLSRAHRKASTGR